MEDLPPAYQEEVERLIADRERGGSRRSIGGAQLPEFPRTMVFFRECTASTCDTFRECSGAP